jgi:hypothetical protein
MTQVMKRHNLNTPGGVCQPRRDLAKWQTRPSMPATVFVLA